MHGADAKFGARSRQDDDVMIGKRQVDVGPSTRFDDFYAERWPHAFRLAALMTHDTEAGADIAQDVFANMSRRWETIERPDAYLQRALTNASSNWRRAGRTAARRLHLLVVRGDGDDEVPLDGLAEAVARLPFRQRAVVVLRYYADLSEAEIARALDCRPGTVKSLGSRALAALSKEVGR
jgi:RNA polymerase sigma-70 factor (sigma-E family)